MARLPYVDPESLDPDTRKILDKQPPLNIFRTLAHAGNAFHQFSRLGNALLFRSDLDPILREMAIVRVGLLSEAVYEVDQHERISRKIGMDEAKLQALKNGSADPVFTDLERLVIRFAEELVAGPRVTEETFRACQRHFDNRQMVELTLTCGFYLMTARFLETMQVDLEDAATETLDV